MHRQTKECDSRLCVVCHSLAPPTLAGSSALFVMLRMSSAKIIPATSLSCMSGETKGTLLVAATCDCVGAEETQLRGLAQHKTSRHGQGLLSCQLH